MTTAELLLREKLIVIQSYCETLLHTGITDGERCIINNVLKVIKEKV